MGPTIMMLYLHNCIHLTLYMLVNDKTRKNMNKLKKCLIKMNNLKNVKNPLKIEVNGPTSLQEGFPVKYILLTFL